MTSPRPCTPPVLVETTNLYLHDLEMPPYTPPHRLPLVLKECPPAPRPRKRVFQASNFEDMPAHLFLPADAALVESDNDATDLHLLLPESPLAKRNTARPAPRRILRRSLYQNLRLRPMPSLPNNEKSKDDEDDDKVRIAFRRSIPNADLFLDPNKKSKLHPKLWAPPSPGIASKAVLKRRNSCNAVCA